MFVNIFLKVLKLQVSHWNLQVGHSVTRGSVVRHPWPRTPYCLNPALVVDERNLVIGFRPPTLRMLPPRPRWLHCVQFYRAENEAPDLPCE